ncbi:MAG: hypothetical protein VYC39_04785 [Myxococcota bacterium]|nr:hypothetical protein [Myxococcota bacterium]
MHTSRLIPYHLAFTLLVFSGVACSSDRYVGSLGKSGMYANRGYGVVIQLNDRDLLSRWEYIDPHKIDIYKESVRPSLTQETIDLNGDGTLHHDEVVVQWKPNFRLVHKDVATSRIDLGVDILGGRNKAADFGAYVRATVKNEFGVETSKGDWKALRLGPDFRAYSTRLKEDGLLLAAIDQGNFSAEEGAVRRQIVWARLKSLELTEQEEKDFGSFLRSLLLNSKAGRQTTWEKY